MAIATYDYVTKDEILARAKKRLGLSTTTSEDNMLSQHLRQGCEEMMTALDLVQFEALIDIDCSGLPVGNLPCNFVKFTEGSDLNSPIIFANDGVPITCTNGSPFYCGNFNIIYEGGVFFNCMPRTGFECNNGTITIKIQNGKIYFSSNVDATQCFIQFMGVNIDENGRMLIPELNARPLENFAMYQWCYDNGRPWQEYQRVWSNTKKHRMALSKLPDVYQRQQLSMIMNSLF